MSKDNRKDGDSSEQFVLMNNIREETLMPQLRFLRRYNLTFPVGFSSPKTCQLRIKYQEVWLKIQPVFGFLGHFYP